MIENLVTLFNLYRNRVRVTIRILEQAERNEEGILRFDAENLGNTPTSILPRVSFNGFLPRPISRTSHRVRMVRYAVDFLISGSGRTLQPYVPVHLEAGTEHASSYVVERLGFMFFKTYTFSFTRGRKKKVHLYSVAPLNVFQYWIGRLLVMIFGISGFKKPDDRSQEVSDALSR